MLSEKKPTGKILTVTLNPCIDKTVTTDGFEYGGLNRAVSTREDIGGKGINVSKVLRNFGADVYAVGFSAGRRGCEVTDFLNKRGILNSFTAAEGEVRTNYKIFDRKSKITTELNESGFFVGQAAVDGLIQSIAHLLPETDIMILSGSVPSGAPADIYKVLTELAKKHGVKVFLDADGERLREGIKALPYAIKPNKFELTELAGRELRDMEEIASCAREYTSAGIELVIVSLGGEGALFVTDERAYRSVPFDIECRSTVAAGDSMVAAAAYALLCGYDIKEVAGISTAAGTITASKDGSEVCTLDEVLRTKEKVTVTPVKTEKIGH